MLLEDIKKEFKECYKESSDQEGSIREQLVKDWLIDDDREKTILHYAAENNLKKVAEHISELFPSSFKDLLNSKYLESGVLYTPLDLALRKPQNEKISCDEIASFLIKMSGEK